MTSRKSLLPFVLLTGALSTNTQATSFVMTTDALVSLSMSATKGTSSSFKDDKVVLAAKTDAAAFVASDGVIRGVQLESALEHIRLALKDEHYSDEQLARAILVM
ncbi:DUF2388 domain-containing protein [Pseudomonas yamanorum]|jgi:uncharacterized protein (TIGR02448 family)|uniref:DUF2388 domain-containing protein n=1 Tax=Pseudomonas yamanorum TaxID=515393 RepID=A0A143GI81_9PSED|nr:MULTISPECIES: DUF2388 domain-containing protein [Pseudomonas]AMW84023.1 hypothetical protein AK972_3223 [Pseudomonas yamanorum]MBK5410691.1 DUF2388 domain-containing protein [Pseudomonas sp. TH34]MBV6662243.1 DUF2388 domain-containing protein [Pseudomonas yamanorum]MDR0189310.1 DUF2388 domain-containing protein [Pseudomonas yamanorum]NVZ91458.1 DUF2388 domain-containing protein [Pseudomonas yamanorum]